MENLEINSLEVFVEAKVNIAKNNVEVAKMEKKDVSKMDRQFVSFLIPGQTGTGKSAEIRNIGKRVFGVENTFTIPCPNIGLGDMIGIGSENEKGNQQVVNNVYFPEIIFNAEIPILVILEELPRIQDAEVNPKIFMMLFDGLLGGKKISPLVQFIATGNIGKRSKSNNLLDDAGLGRLLVLPFVPVIGEKLANELFPTMSGFSSAVLNTVLNENMDIYGYEEAQESMKTVSQKTGFKTMPLRRIEFAEYVLPTIYTLVKSGKVAKKDVPLWEFAVTLTLESDWSKATKSLIDVLRKNFLSDDIISWEVLAKITPKEIEKEKVEMLKVAISTIYSYAIFNGLLPENSRVDLLEWLTKPNKEINSLEKVLRKITPTQKGVLTKWARDILAPKGEKVFSGDSKKPITRVLTVVE